MKILIIIVLALCSISSQAEEKQYESYEDIVQRLSSYRSQQIKSKLSTTVPHEEYHLSLGYSQGFIPMEFGNIGQLGVRGISIGGAIPIVKRQLFVEGFGKFYQSEKTNGYSASVRQIDMRITHKEPMEIAIANFGIGGSLKEIDIDNGIGSSKRTSIPSLLFLLGLERQITPRVSMALDGLYHRSMRGAVDAKNSYEVVVRLNYHL